MADMLNHRGHGATLASRVLGMVREICYAASWATDWLPGRSCWPS